MAPLRHQCAKLVFSENHQEREPSMSEITTIGLDIAKHVFQVHGIDPEGTTVLRRRLRRNQVLAFFSRLPRCVVGLEACATAHYWARELAALGHEVRLMPAQYVKAYIKRNEHDAADAESDLRGGFSARRCALCRSRRLTTKLPCCCTVAGSGWCASVRVW